MCDAYTIRKVSGFRLVIISYSPKCKLCS